MDDPHDSTWYEAPDHKNWCPYHKEPYETCDCGRMFPPGSGVVFFFVAIVCIMLAFAVSRWYF